MTISSKRDAAILQNGMGSVIIALKVLSCKQLQTIYITMGKYFMLRKLG
jgi:hypothetical protein